MGKIFVVATPIGNLGDMTFRAVETLKNCDFVVCEDKRVTGRLLSHFEISAQMVSLNEFNEEERTFEVLGRVANGENAALVSDGGTPLISDPGYRLVSTAVKKGISVVPIPGASAVIAALSVSGLPTNNFYFVGFLPKKETKREKYLRSLFESQEVLSKDKIFPTVVIYESPKRLVATLDSILKIFGDIEIVVVREITKIHEEFARGKISEIIEKYENENVRGEITFLLSLKK